MDKTHIQNGITFVWDQKKAATNIAKHDGISFEQATQAFFDPFLRVVEASQNNETRDAIIGMDKMPLLVWINSGAYCLSCIF
jgi:uncharacterized DUF497 family protein